MEWNEQQYEEVAEGLDGRKTDLTADQNALAEEIRRLEATIGALLDVSAGSEVMERVRLRMLGQPAAQPRRTLRWAGLFSAAAAAAAVLLAVALWRQASVDRIGPSSPPSLANVSEVPDLREIDQLDEEVQDLEDELMVSRDPGPQDAVWEVLYQDSDEVLLDDLEVELES
jgi:hypothetical protein